MVFIGYHASHEQLPPSRLLAAVQEAERAGFDGAMCSDHFAPWGLAQGESGHAWSWLGAALATTRFSLGVVTAPGQRYHPAVSAQAFATLSEMFPGRFWAALGSGEALNEHITGDEWPPKPEREQRLVEVVDVIRRLHAGERVDHDGLVRVHDARVWSLPSDPPALRAAAASARTASLTAAWADGLITVGHDPGTVRQIIEAYREAGGRGPCAVQVHVCLAGSDGDGLQIAREQWPQATVPPQLMWEIAQPEEFDRLADPTDRQALERGVLISADDDETAEKLAALAAVGADELYLHEVGTDQSAFLARAGGGLLDLVRRLT
ncbi:TIGR03885 family FMN-dependent LLM class oxidoreductase [Microbacterium sp. M3]|uniref:TIGR03885 family FMN-dependent LLM class oxidoreductase n=1 Tax=Microbacterium arthrosphaerae TaxID=792652 RepID=A0ABU4GZY6_9MICO|nr:MULTISPECIES: TIGR03885 family FMN-dependent LLM class oxidoreductase [Microbacterium]MDW4571189.1 TIGR03885 family FMN-dependent LLM class oxidoreductase [Microbacterium arthrosphaerae]MDW7605044.1 TIGR03885 family FMN-dependent LLM class oxidoreductase [Microbacterium sp. M3]